MRAWLAATAPASPITIPSSSERHALANHQSEDVAAGRAQCHPYPDLAHALGNAAG